MPKQGFTHRCWGLKPEFCRRNKAEMREYINVSGRLVAAAQAGTGRGYGESLLLTTVWLVICP